MPTNSDRQHSECDFVKLTSEILERSGEYITRSSTHCYRSKTVFHYRSRVVFRVYSTWEPVIVAVSDIFLTKKRDFGLNCFSISKSILFFLATKGQSLRQHACWLIKFEQFRMISNAQDTYVPLSAHLFSSNMTKLDWREARVR